MAVVIDGLCAPCNVQLQGILEKKTKKPHSVTDISVNAMCKR